MENSKAYKITKAKTWGFENRHFGFLLINSSIFSISSKQKCNPLIWKIPNNLFGLHCMLQAITTPNETRCYISNRALSAEELLDLTRQEWAVESMHWQLDVIYNEDRTTLNGENAQKTLNILRKTALNITRIYRDKFEPKQSMTGIMRKCLFNPDFLLIMLKRLENVTAL